MQPGRTKARLTRIRVIGVHRELLVEIDEEGTRREGFRDRGALFDYWRSLHGDVDLAQPVWAIRFVKTGA